MADELLASGAIEQAAGRLRLSARGYVPGTDIGDLIAMLGIDTAQFMETIDHNLRNEGKRYQRKVEYENVPAEHAAEFRVLSARLAQQVLEELDRWLAARRADPEGGAVSGLTLGLGIFQIEESRVATRGADANKRNDDHEHD